MEFGKEVMISTTVCVFMIPTVQCYGSQRVNPNVLVDPSYFYFHVQVPLVHRIDLNLIMHIYIDYVGFYWYIFA